MTEAALIVAVILFVLGAVWSVAEKALIQVLLFVGLAAFAFAFAHFYAR